MLLSTIIVLISNLKVQSLDSGYVENNGVIYKIGDIYTLPSNITTNNKYVFNGDLDPFVITNNFGKPLAPIVVFLPQI